MPAREHRPEHVVVCRRGKKQSRYVRIATGWGRSELMVPLLIAKRIHQELTDALARVDEERAAEARAKLGGAGESDEGDG